MLVLDFERLESEPGCFVKKGVTHKDTIIVVVHVDDLLSVGKRKHLDNFFVQLEKTLKLKRVEFIGTSKSSKTRSLSRARIRMWTKCSRCWAWRVANQQAHLWQTTTKKWWKRFRGRNVSVICRYLDVFQETPFCLALCGKVSGNGEFLADKGSHALCETSFALHSRHAKHASGIGSAPRTVDGIGCLV